MWLCSIQLADSFVATRRPVGVIGGSCKQFNLSRKVLLSTEASPETLRLVNETEVLHCVYSRLCLTVLTTFACKSRLRTRSCVNFTWRVRPWTAGWLDNAQLHSLCSLLKDSWIILIRSVRQPVSFFETCCRCSYTPQKKTKKWKKATCVVNFNSKQAQSFRYYQVPSGTF